jgi:membrane-associated phospholipid phosphatase
MGDWNAGLEWERMLMLRVHSIEFNPAADWLILAAPWLGTNWTTLPIAVALSIWLIFWKRRMDLALPILVIQAGSNTLNAILKHMAWRERPELWDKRGQFAWPSYPSGHAIATMSVLLFLAILLAREKGARWAGVVIVPLVLLVLYSRIYLGVHWPTDVVGGVIVGVIWLMTIFAAFPLGRRSASSPDQAR